MILIQNENPNCHSHKLTFLFVSSTRSDPHMKLNVKEYRNEDVVLMLPPEKPTIKELGHFQVKIVVKTIQDILLKIYIDPTLKKIK